MQPTTATPAPQSAAVPASLARYRGLLSKLVEITALPQSPPADGFGLSAAERALLNRQYTFLLDRFNEAVAQLPTQPAAVVAA
jgi:hypothetical protein